MTAGVVIVGYDGSDGAQHAVEWAARAAVSLGAELRIVHAVGLDEGRTRWCVEDGDPTTALLRAADEAQEDGHPVLLVVGSRGAGAHAGTLLGSTSLELAEHAYVPVTIVPPAGRPRRREG